MSIQTYDTNNKIPKEFGNEAKKYSTEQTLSKGGQ